MKLTKEEALNKGEKMKKESSLMDRAVLFQDRQATKRHKDWLDLGFKQLEEMKNQNNLLANLLALWQRKEGR